MGRSKAVLLAVFVGVVMMLSGCQVVEDGTQGVRKQLGNFADQPLGSGVHANIPVLYEVEVWNVKTQRRTRRMALPSKEGLTVGIEATVLFRAADVVSLRKTVGRNYIPTVLEPDLIDIFREIVGQTRAEDLYREKEVLTTRGLDELQKRLAARGIAVEGLTITDVELPADFKQAIERKIQSEQKALQKEFELQQAKKDAEIEIARAEGLAKAQKIVSKTLSPEYLQYLWIDTLNDNPNVIYVATEANMPMFRTAKSGGKLGAISPGN